MSFKTLFVIPVIVTTLSVWGVGQAAVSSTAGPAPSTKMAKIAAAPAVEFAANVIVDKSAQVALPPADQTKGGFVEVNNNNKNPQMLTNATQVYMELDNNGHKIHTIIAAYSPIAKRLELHQSEMIRGQKVMRHLTQIVLKPGKNNLVKGGLHVMLIDLQKSVKSGQKIPVVLLFKDGSWLKVDAPVA